MQTTTKMILVIFCIGARRTDLVVALTGVVVTAGAAVTAGAVVTAGVVVGIPGMDAHPVRRCRVDVARLTDGDDEVGGKFVRLPWAKPHRVMERAAPRTVWHLFNSFKRNNPRE
jgi:hypothetical protein